MDERSAGQLGTIDEISKAWSEEKIEHWLFGGWAFDFLTGEQRRPHDDVDFVVWAADSDATAAVLARLGFEEAAFDHPDEGSKWERSDVRVELAYVLRGEDGRVVSPGRWDRLEWPPESFGVTRARFEGVEVPVISPQGALFAKEILGAHPAARARKASDDVDAERLRNLY